jgi:hypothetical protein
MEVEPVVSYTRLPSDGAKPESGEGERVEPRFTVLPMERKARREEIAPPSVEDAELHGARFEAAPLEPLPPPPTERRRRFPLFATVGLVALLVAFGVLAATFSRVVTGGNTAAVAPADTSTAVTLAPAPAEPEDTAGPGVRMIAPDATGTAQSDQAAPAAVTDVAPTAPTDGVTVTATATMETAALPAATLAPADSPLPRLRPTMPTATGAQTDVAALPPPTANLPPPTAAAPAQQGDDVSALMSDVDRILQQHRATVPPAAPAPLATTDAGTAVAMTSPAPLDVTAPPVPQRRGWFLYPDRNASGLPVPPADIPDPEGAPGQ